MVPLPPGASGRREAERARAAVRTGSRAPTFPLEVCKYDDSKLLVMISRMRDVSATEQHECSDCEQSFHKTPTLGCAFCFLGVCSLFREEMFGSLNSILSLLTGRGGCS